ncbi:MAG: hypothetical protein K0U47_03570 [Epsilonproteobacteria bacterium]|nr:hypothetical protein [Campylobacterota bacterium]
MKFFLYIVLSIVTIGFVGCGSSGELPQDSETQLPPSGDVVESVVPEVLPSEGTSVTFQDYLYPYNTLIDGGTTAQNVYLYNQSADGTLYYDRSILKSFNRTTDAGGNTVINESDDALLVQTDVIESTKITAFMPDGEGAYTQEVYPYSLAKNDQVTRVTAEGVTMVCIVKDIIFGLQNLESLIPQDVQSDLLTHVTGGVYTADQFTYVNTMHIYCGATNGTTIDSYHVSGWGEVLSITKEQDNTTRYEILDKKSIQYY